MTRQASRQALQLVSVRVWSWAVTAVKHGLRREFRILCAQTAIAQKQGA